MNFASGGDNEQEPAGCLMLFLILGSCWLAEAYCCYRIYQWFSGNG